jgi:signal transduction histidine kinase
VSGIKQMTDRLLLRMTSPLLGISVLLLAVGLGSAWYIERVQQDLSDVLELNVSSMRAAEELELGLGEVRNHLVQYLLTGDRRHLEKVPALRAETDHWLAEAVRTGTTPREQELMARVCGGYDRFFAELERVAAQTTSEEESRKKVQQLMDEVLTEEILRPAHQYLDLNEAMCVESTAANRAAASWMVGGLLLLGTCGPAAGVLAGVGISRHLSRSLVRLSLPLRDAAGKLNQVVGPVTLSPGWGLEELEGVLRRLADQVGAVIEQLQQSQREALRAEQLAAVGQLAAGLAHELRNPLMSMKILVQSAGDRGDPAGLGVRGLAVLEEEIDRLEHLTRTFLEFARPPQPEKRILDARAVVEDAIRLVSGKAGRCGVPITCATGARPVPLLADAGQLRQLLLNLLLNAIEALPRGGSVVVRVDRAEDGRSPAAVLEVTDTGPGLPNGLGQDIFHPFVSTKLTGLGLGLSICRRIVDAHGGTIQAANRPEGGAVFTVRMPGVGP